jgi:16S rRNA (guanine527-N7)-methyltransferase
MPAEPRPRPGFAPRPFPLSLEPFGSRFQLALEQLRRLASFASRLAFDPDAPTTVRDPRAVVDDHLADTLVALRLPEVRSREAGGVIADLGSGAGVPGLVLAICLPRCDVFLVEANGRKCAIMRSVAGDLGLGNATVVSSRVEAWRDGLGRCDLVTARALAGLDVVAEYAAPLLCLGGQLVAWRGRRDRAAEAAGARAAAILGLAVAEPVQVRPHARADHRHLHVLTKVAATPAKFPRRDGVARKRPLGAAGAVT